MSSRNGRHGLGEGTEVRVRPRCPTGSLSLCSHLQNRFSGSCFTALGASQEPRTSGLCLQNVPYLLEDISASLSFCGHSLPQQQPALDTCLLAWKTQREDPVSSSEMRTSFVREPDGTVEGEAHSQYTGDRGGSREPKQPSHLFC